MSYWKDEAYMLLVTGFKCFATNTHTLSVFSRFASFIVKKPPRLLEPICTSSAPTPSYSVYFLRCLYCIYIYSDVYVPSAPTFTSETSNVYSCTDCDNFFISPENSHFIAAPSSHTKICWTTRVWVGRLLSTACMTSLKSFVGFYVTGCGETCW